MEKESISVIGMGCRFPGGANNLNTFWDILINNKSVISDIPNDRWNVEDYYSENQEAPGKMYSKKGGFIDIPLKNFDAQFFNIPPKEARNLDPHQRLSLEVCYESIEDAFLVPEKLKNSNTGVFLGMSYDEFNVYKKKNVFNSDEHIDAYSLTGSNFSCAAGRIAYSFGLEGPCMSIDTACSSSLVAVHQAKMSLLSGECDLAFVIGATIIINPDLNIAFCKLKALSVDGLCKTFDAKADGYVRSEGCGAIILKRTSDAKRDNNRIRAIIKGSSVNQDGASDSFTAPSQKAQEKNLIRAYKDAEVSLESVDYIEAHGTGTALGDAVELDAIVNVVGKNRTKSEPVYIGSVKTNIGHLEPAAGMAGLIKVILSMEKGQLPANLNFSQPNPRIDWKNSNLAVPTKNMPWEKKESIIAGINAFGFSGTNVHIVVEQSDSHRTDESKYLKKETSIINKESILCLSAKTSNSLKSIITNYVDFINKNRYVKVSEICHLAYTGRTHYKYRLAAVGKTHDEIIDSLTQNQIFNSKQKTKNLKQRQTAVFFGNENIYQKGKLVKELFDGNVAFKESFIKCDAIIQSQWGISVRLDYLSKEENPVKRKFLGGLFDFTVEYSILKTIESLGLNVNVVVGSNISTEYAFKCFKNKSSIKDTLSELEKDQKSRKGLNNVKSFEEQKISQKEEDNSSSRMGSNEKTLIEIKDFQYKRSLADYVKSLNQNTYHLMDVESGLISRSVQEELTDVQDLSLLDRKAGLSKFFTKMYHWGADLNSLYLDDNLYNFVDLPTYAFDRKEFWLKLDSDTRKSSSFLSPTGISLQGFPLEEDYSFENGDWNADRLEEVFKGQLDQLTNQVNDVVGLQLDILKNKWINNNVTVNVRVDYQVEVWSPFSENRTDEWKVIFVNSDNPLENSSIIDVITEKLTSKSLSSQPSTKIKVNGKPSHRMALVCKNYDDASKVLKNNLKKQILKTKNSPQNYITHAFMFTGLGEQYEQMGIGLYQKIPSFKETMDYCFNHIKSNFGFDLKKVLFIEEEATSDQQKGGFDLRAMLGKKNQCSNKDKNPINRTLYAHTSILIVQYALGKLLMSWGIKPAYLIGHSLGEFSAACFADVLSIEDAIYLVVKRAELIEESLSEGRMLAVSLSAERMKTLLIEIKMEERISISLVNSPQSVVVSGSIENISIMQKLLAEKEILFRLLRSVRGFHSHMLDPIKKNLRALFSNIKFRKNEIPYVSNVTGKWITEEQCIDPDYWVRHTCRTVQFEKGIKTLLDKDLTHLIEVGPGNSLCSFIAQNPLTASKRNLAFLPSMTGVYNNDDDDFFLKKLIARIWIDGGDISNNATQSNLENYN